MKLSRRDKSAEAEVEADVPDVPAEPEHHNVTASKGRPTPKRRDSQGARGPVSAPKTRKEAYARQKQQSKDERAAAKTAKAASGAKPRTIAEQRAALKRGDPSALPRRDQGNTRAIARDYVDSRRMASNYLLFIFPVLIVISFVPQLAIAQTFMLLVIVVLFGEWIVAGRRIRALAKERHGAADGSNVTIGIYAGSRAYLPRRWRLPGPRVELGDEI